MKPKLLVVDDDHSVRESLRKLLEAQGYEVLSARDAVEALEAFNSQCIDLVVLDINLGVDNGWQVFETMTFKNPFVPTIVITAEWGQRERAVALGVEGLIEKPIDVPVLLKLIRELLTETTTTRLNRLCGNDAYCRYSARHYEPYLRLLQKRYAAPFRIRSGDATQPRPSPESNPTLPELIPASATLHGCRSESRPGARRTALHPPETDHEDHRLEKLDQA